MDLEKMYAAPRPGRTGTERSGGGSGGGGGRGVRRGPDRLGAAAGAVSGAAGGGDSAGRGSGAVREPSRTAMSNAIPHRSMGPLLVKSPE